jgi:hypothetical protein
MSNRPIGCIVETTTDTQIYNTAFRHNKVGEIIDSIFSRPILWDDNIRKIVITEKQNKNS